MTTIENLEKELKSGLKNNLYLFYGEETFLLENCVKKIKNQFGELIKGINYIQMDETNIDNIISDIETPAFGYPKKLIIVKYANLFQKIAKTSSTKKEKEIAEKLSKYLTENKEILNESAVLIFIEQEAQKNKLYTTIEELGVVCNFEKLKPAQIIKRLKAITNAYKVNIDESTLQYFIETCGTSMQDLINEIRKLIEYVGENGTITKEDIEKLSIKQIDAVIFDLTDCLGKKDIQTSIILLKELIYQKEPIQKIFITLYNHFRKLYLVKLAEQYNRNLAEAMGLKPNQMFLTSKYKKQAEYFKQIELRQILQEFMDLDKNYKTGLIDIDIGLQSILCRYCS